MPSCAFLNSHKQLHFIVSLLIIYLILLPLESVLLRGRMAQIQPSILCWRALKHQSTNQSTNQSVNIIIIIIIIIYFVKQQQLLTII